MQSEGYLGGARGATVIPLFRGRQAPTVHPMAALRNAAWKKPDVARLFRVSERTVERWQSEEGLPTEKPFGPKGAVRYDVAKVMAWWDARCANRDIHPAARERVESRRAEIAREAELRHEPRPTVVGQIEDGGAASRAETPTGPATLDEDVPYVSVLEEHGYAAWVHAVTREG
jgi:predicted DNA-binding transcriptional regulator AlpA